MDFELQRIVQTALREDIGIGDVTTRSTVDPSTVSQAEMVAKEDFVLAGIKVAGRVFKTLDPEVSFEALVEDGQSVKRGDVLAWIKGSASVLLQGERVALNLLQRMSGIATLTAEYVREIEGTKATIVDTRKTMPGLRVLDKYAVRAGGGSNHRTSLYDGVLIKENHIRAAGGISEAIKKARQQIPHTLKIEVETTSIEEVEEALAAGADIIMLDNMGLKQMEDAVALIDGKARAEASGGINLETVRAIAETGVDLISVGALTHSCRAVDISMLFES